MYLTPWTSNRHSNTELSISAPLPPNPFFLQPLPSQLMDIFLLVSQAKTLRVFLYSSLSLTYHTKSVRKSHWFCSQKPTISPLLCHHPALNHRHLLQGLLQCSPDLLPSFYTLFPTIYFSHCVQMTSNKIMALLCLRQSPR